MNPSSKNWLEEYLIFYKNQESPNIQSEDELYKIMLNSSLLFAVALDQSKKLHPDFDKWTSKEKMRIIFAHHLFIITDFYIYRNKSSLSFSDIYKQFALSENTELSIESYIDNLIGGKRDSLFLNTYNINPWLFLPLIRFYFFLKKESVNTNQLKIDILKGMYTAVKVDDEISKNEKRLLKRYISNSDLSEEEQEIIKTDSDIQSMTSSLSEREPWIKKICYDLALFALMSDRKIGEKELQFVNEYADVLNISLPEQHLTFSLIQNIYLNHYTELPHLRKTYSYESVKNVVNHNFTYILKKNSGMITNEIRESKELIALLRKSTDEKLSEEEKAKIREQILDLLKTIPSLTIFMIPGGTIILPLLMKILPEDLLYPSSFINKNAKS